MSHICSYCVYMKKTKHPPVRIDSDVMDDLEKISNDPYNKISKTRFVTKATRKEIDRLEKEKRDIILKDLINHYQDRASSYYEKGIKNIDDFISMLAENKDVLEIEKEGKEYRDVAIYALDVFDKLKDDLKEKLKNLQII